MTTATPTPKTIHDLRKYDGPIYIANRSPFLITCNETFGANSVKFELPPQGEPGSTRTIPNLALEVRGLQNLWIRGDVAISTDEAMEDEITLQLNQSIQAPQDRLNSIMARGDKDAATPVVEGSANNRALTQKACLECGAYDPKTGVIIRGAVTQTMTEVKDGIPPLCKVHTSMSTQFTPRPVADNEGNVSWEFDKVTLTSPVRGAS